MIWAAFERRLDQAQVPADQRPDYHNWTRFYLDFCRKYELPPRALTSGKASDRRSQERHCKDAEVQ